jgi:O-antigen ligase
MSFDHLALREAERVDWLAWSASATLLASIVLGGGGAEAPLLNGLLEAAGALLLCMVTARHLTGRPLPPTAIMPIALLIALLLLILAQLIPLPPAWWNGLPGRQATNAIVAVNGSSDTWLPLSLDPEASRRFAAALLLPTGIFVAAITTSHQGRLVLAGTVVTGALLSALLAAAQVASGLQAPLFPFGRAGAAVPTGLFANPNHQAQLMLAALVMSGVIVHFAPDPPRRHRRGKPPFHPAWLLLPLFMAGVAITQSWAGLILLPPALLAAVWIGARRRSLARIFGWSAIAILAAAAVTAIFSGGPAEGMKLQLEYSAGGRITSFPDIIYTLRQYWPWGSGFGTFVPVFKANENLDLMGDYYLNHAHNELLELLIEGGLPMAILLAVGLIVMSVRLWRLATARGLPEPVLALAGLAVLLLAMLHSLVDYPLRMHSLAAVAAVGLAMFQSVVPRHGQASSSPHYGRGK